MSGGEFFLRSVPKKRVNRKLTDFWELFNIFSPDVIRMDWTYEGIWHDVRELGYTVIVGREYGRGRKLKRTYLDKNMHAKEVGKPATYQMRVREQHSVDDQLKAANEISSQYERTAKHNKAQMQKIQRQFLRLQTRQKRQYTRGKQSNFDRWLNG